MPEKLKSCFCKIDLFAKFEEQRQWHQTLEDQTYFGAYKFFKLQFYCFFFCCPYLSYIHKKANCIAVVWTGCPHSLGSCHFRGVWATCLPYKSAGVPLSTLPKDTTSELAGLFSTTSLKYRASSKEVVNISF